MNTILFFQRGMIPPPLAKTQRGRRDVGLGVREGLLRRNRGSCGSPSTGSGGAVAIARNACNRSPIA